MTDDQHGEGAPQGGGRWDPLPQGDYDDGATAFVKLPEGAIDALMASADSPLAAPGHGYVPPQITVAPATIAGTDPAATGNWPAPAAPVDGTQWHVPDAGQQQHPATGEHTGYAQQDPYGRPTGYEANAGQDDPYAYDPGATAQWDYSGAAPAPAGHDVTGQWSIPVADGDLPDESGEFTTSSLAEQWGGTAPATLPGGAPAPWATQPWAQPSVPADETVEDRQGESGAVTSEGFEPTAEPAAPDGPAASGVTAPPAGAVPAEEPVSYEGPDAPAGPVGPGGHVSPAGRDASTGAVPSGGAEPSAGHVPAVGPVSYGGPDAPAGQTPSAAADVPAESVPPAGHPAAASSSGPEAVPPSGPEASAGSASAAGPASSTGPVSPAGPAVSAGHEPAGPESSAGPAAPAGPASTPDDAPSAEQPAGARPEAPAGPAAAAPPVRSAGEPAAGEAEEAPEGAAEPAAAPAGARRTEPGPEAAQEPRTDADPDEPRDPDSARASEQPAPAPHPARTTGDGAGPKTPADAAPEEPAPADAAPQDTAPAEAAPAGPQDEHPLASYVLRVNGADRPVTDAWIGESLLYVLRERLGLAGAKDGCSQGECGACNVQVDGRLVASCLVPAVTAAGSEVRTVEGLAVDGQPSDVQRALARCGAVQCGFCVPGMAMTVHNLLEGNPAPTELEARQALCGNLCRCSGYRGVLEAVQEVVAEREAHAAADAAEAETDEPRIPHQAGPGAGGVAPSAFASSGPPGTPDAPAPQEQQPYGDHSHGGPSYGDEPYGDQPHGERSHGQDGGHA
ncbi:2Fe-2S iron-sulfur cluster-binding protein [Streptomyces sp. NPDC047725]|uniref:(2Fe-2S)-binding protein n=1 Tax=Streptomyces sp. NPDC047725 TaxID=3365487 RepID=UPI003710653B